MKKNPLTQFIRLLVIACLLVSVSACDNNNNSETTSVVMLPGNIQKLVLPSGALSAWLTVNGTRTQMTIDSAAGTASVIIAGLPRTTLEVLIEFEFTDSNQTIKIATSTRLVDLSAGSATTSFVDADYTTSYDEDQDGLSNVEELAWGKNPFGQPAFSTSCFPFSIANNFGNLVFNYDGDLLIADGSDIIRLMDHATCDLTTLATVTGVSLVALGEDKVRNRIYSGFSDNLYEINPDTGDSLLLVSIGATFYNIVVAPPGFGDYGGQLIVGTSNGKILAIDQSVSNPVPSEIAAVAGDFIFNVLFGNDGTLYAAQLNGSKIVTVEVESNALTDFVIGLNDPTGLEIDNSGSRLFISDRNSNDLFSSLIPSGDLTSIDSVNFSTGGLPDLAYDNHDTMLMITGASQIEARSTAPFNTSCLPLTVTGAAFSVASYADYGVGDLLLASYTTDDIRLLKRSDCTLTTLASSVSGNSLLGITYDRRLNKIYAGSTGNNIYTVDPIDGSSTLLTAVAALPNGVVVAPSSYGPYGGQLIVALSDGGIYAIDQTQVSPAPVLIVDIGGAASDLVFGSDGTLYVADFSANNILTVIPGEVPTFFAGNLNGPDGLAIDNNGLRLLVANSGDSTLKQVTIPTGVSSDLGTVTLDVGFLPSGIFYDRFSTVLVGVGANSQSISAFGL